MIKFLIIAILCVACSKAVEFTGPNRYTMMIDKYNMDTTILKDRLVWWSDTVSVIKEVAKLEIAEDIWYHHCPDAKGEWLEHIYYLRNGAKIQPSKYPIH